MTAFFPFNPKRMRTGLAAGAAFCALIAGWAAWSAYRGLERFGEARAVVALVLMGAFFYALWKLRPRAGWGVELTPLKLTVSRPLSPDVIELVPSMVTQIRGDRQRPGVLAVELVNGERLLLQRHLFANDFTFEELAKALRAWKPEPRLDA